MNRPSPSSGFLYPALAAGSVALSLFFGNVATSDAEEWEQCLQKKMTTADDTATVGDLRRQCRQDAEEGEQSLPSPQGAVEERLQQEKKNVLTPFSIMTHKPNYILPAAYNSRGYSAEHHREANGDGSYSFDQVEAQFQISIKSPLVVGLFDDRMDVYAAYTNHSFWQVYNRDISAPFRETNHEPELWAQFKTDWELFGIKNTCNSLGINHQSNGQSGGLSRSWNRLFGTFVFEYGDLGINLTPWYRLPESADDDDNPDIIRYLGNFELGAVYKWENNTFSLMTRNCLESDFHRGTVQASWSFPIWGWPYLRGYVQYFNGYGESLIDYNQNVNRLGVGLSLSDWL